MNKQDFFTIVREGLNDFPKEELDDILKEYEGYFNKGFSQGKTEEEIINTLDNPFMLVNKYRNNYLLTKESLLTNDNSTNENFNSSSNDNNINNTPPNNTSNNTTNKNNGNTILKVLITALLLVIFGPFILSTFGVIIGLLISLIFIPLGLLMGGTGFLFNRFGIKLIGFSIPTFLVDFPINVAVLITLGSLFATILFIILTYYFIKLIILWIKKLILKNSTKEV